MTSTMAEPSILPNDTCVRETSPQTTHEILTPVSCGKGGHWRWW